MKNRQVHSLGFTFIELIIFIVITGFAVATLTPLIVTLHSKSESEEQFRAIELAQQCMELNLNKKKQVGFTDFTQPESCTVPAGFYYDASVTSDWPTSGPDSNYKTITVEIKKGSSSGRELAVLKTLIADY